MCGRFTLRAPPERIAESFGLEEVPVLAPRFNVAPGQAVATIQAAPGAGRVLRLRRWGLVPHWARDPRIGSRLVNARSETVASKPAFRDAFRKRRCLVPADGFYEWAPAGRGARQPHHLARSDEGLLALAGLFDSWQAEGAPPLETCTVLTTRPNAVVAPIHDRMPVILAPADWDAWLDPEERDPTRLAPLLRPAPDDLLRATAVGLRVNRPEHDDAACLAPAPQETLF